MNPVELITEPFQYAFMLRALAVVVIVGVLSAVVGTFVVLRGMSFYGNALAHAILPGVAVGYLAGARGREGLFWWALLAAALSTALIAWIRHGVRLKEDTAIGITFSGMLALGVVLVSSSGSYAVDLTHFLFGNVLAVTDAALLRTAVAAIVVLIVLALLYRRLLLVAFDPGHARLLRQPVGLLDTALLALIALTIVIALQTVGIALMTALLITPAATGSLIARRVPQMMAAGASVAVGGGTLGLIASYWLNLAPGAAMVLVMTVLFGVVAALRALRPQG